MKIPCLTCGCHFEDEFDQTLMTDCRFWDSRGASSLRHDTKKKIWDYLVSVEPLMIETAQQGLLLEVSYMLQPNRITLQANDADFGTKWDGKTFTDDRERREAIRDTYKRYFKENR